MPRRIRAALTYSLMAIGLAIGCLTVRPVSAASQGGLELRRTKYFVDQNTRVWLSIHLINAGAQPITIASVAPDRSGPWTKIGQTAAPGALVRLTMPAPDGGAKGVWINSSVGLLHFDLQKAR